VPVDDANAATPPGTPDAALEVPLAAVDPLDGWDARVSLFGDLER
jgi:hypothetical protein